MGFKSDGFGFAAGYDLQGEANALGVNASFVTTDVKDRGAAAATICGREQKNGLHVLERLYPFPPALPPARRGEVLRFPEEPH